MCDPPPKKRDNIQLAVLREPTVTGEDLLIVSADFRWRRDLPGPPTDGRTRIVDENGESIQFGLTPSREAGVSARPAGAPLQTSAFIHWG